MDSVCFSHCAHLVIKSREIFLFRIDELLGWAGLARRIGGGIENEGINVDIGTHLARVTADATKASAILATELE